MEEVSKRQSLTKKKIKKKLKTGSRSNEVRGRVKIKKGNSMRGGVRDQGISQQTNKQ